MSEAEASRGTDPLNQIDRKREILWVFVVDRFLVSSVSAARRNSTSPTCAIGIQLKPMTAFELRVCVSSSPSFFLLYLRLSASLTTTPLNGNNEKARTRKYTMSRNSASSDGVGYSHGIIIISQPHSEVTYIRKREPRSFMNWK